MATNGIDLQQSTIVKPNTTVLYRFENNDYDSSINGHDLSEQGTVPYTSSFVSPYNSSASAGVFSASNYFLSPASLNTALSGISVYTIEFYVYLLGSSNNPTICQFVNTLGNNQIQVRQGGTNSLIRWWANNVMADTGEIFLLNQWNHIAVTYDGTSRKLFLNYNEIYSFDNLGSFGTVSQVRIGYPTWPGEYVNGYLDNFRISNVARTSFPTLD